MQNFSAFILALVSVLLLTASPTLAVHEGGVANCKGCHATHGSDVMLGGPTATGPTLLLGSDPSSTCLRCHSGAGANGVFSPAGSALTPGGDFYWLKRSFNWNDGSGIPQSSPGYTHGHSVIATDYGLGPDSIRLQAPGGTYPASTLSCISCHDPHGKIASPDNPAPISGSGSFGGSPPGGSAVGNYRLLGGIGYKGLADTTSFTQAAPIAAAPVSGAETDDNHAAYGSGMSNWCGNCHGDYLSGGTASHHPAGATVRLLTAEINQYNVYLASGDLTATPATSYSALVPFETGDTDRTLLDPSSTSGPTGNANVTCLTCHRAHASAFGVIGRWDLSLPFSDFLVNSHPDGTTDGSTPSEKLYSYYNRDIEADFGAGQKPFCEKCHVGGSP